jgi:hypothetical protein
MNPRVVLYAGVVIVFALGYLLGGIEAAALFGVAYLAAVYGASLLGRWRRDRS